MEQEDDRSAASVRTLELVVAALIFVLGALVVFDSWRLGASWAEDGPQAGYFPFYIGMILCVASLLTFVQGLRDRASASESFVSVAQLKLVLAVLVPTVIYVLLIAYFGFYLASTVFIAFFMIWLGKYGWFKTAAVSIGVSVASFLLFDIWFKLPMPKGPLEAALGLN